MFLALAIWLGALVFFPAVAATAFANLPSHSAGLVVRGSLVQLHCLGFVCGVVFLASFVIYNRIALGKVHILSVSNGLIGFMLALTAISQFHIIPRMDAMRLAAGEISSLPASDPIRAQFDSLHAWSIRLEGTVLIVGILLLYLASRRIAGRN